MQVNSINSNQNFGMALRISPKATRALKELPLEEINKIGEIGEMMKGFKHVDMELDEFLEPLVINKNTKKAYRATYEPIYTEDNTLTVVSRMPRKEGRVSLYGYNDATLHFDSKIEAKHAMETLSKKDGIDAAAEYARLLEKSEEYVISKNIEDAVYSILGENNAVAQHVKNLIKDFGKLH